LSDERFQVSVAGEKDTAVLRLVTDTLEVDDVRPFREACRKLLNMGRPKVCVDLCGFKSVPSTIVGAVIEAHVQALAQGQELVLMVDAATGEVLRKLFRGFIGIVASPSEDSSADASECP